jgi:HEAT repeats
MTNSDETDLTPDQCFERLNQLTADGNAAGTDEMQRLDARLRDLSAVQFLGLLHANLHVPNVRESHAYWTCVGGLQSIGTPDIFDTCKSWARHPKPEFREAAAAILSQLGYAEDKPYRALSTPILERLLSDGTFGVVSAALYALGHLQSGDIDLIASFSTHPETRVRRGVVSALTSRETDLALHTLIQLSSDDDADIRDWATFGLGTQSDADTPALRDALFARLDDDDDDTRCEAIAGLAKRSDQRVIPAILNELEGNAFNCAIEAAGMMPSPSFVPTLADLLEMNPGDRDIANALNACLTGVPYDENNPSDDQGVQHT